MLGYTDLLRAGQLGSLNEKQHQVIGEMQESAQRLQRLIQDLLLLCELRAGRCASKELEAAEVNAPLAEIFQYWAPVAKQKNLKYDFQPAPADPRVMVDSSKLQHIISNLIENAIKYTPAGGRVSVNISGCFWERRKAQSEFLFNLERQGNRKVENAVTIDVIDNGPGIPIDRQQDVFMDFVQLPGSSSRGTGLGLAIARRLVEANEER